MALPSSNILDHFRDDKERSCDGLVRLRLLGELQLHLAAQIVEQVLTHRLLGSMVQKRLETQLKGFLLVNADVHSSGGRGNTTERIVSNFHVIFELRQLSLVIHGLIFMFQANEELDLAEVELKLLVDLVNVVGQVLISV